MKRLRREKGREEEGKGKRWSGWTGKRRGSERNRVKEGGVKVNNAIGVTYFLDTM